MLARSKLAFPVDESAALLAMLRETGDQSPPATASLEAADPADKKFVTCAIAGRAECIVTGNKRHFPDAPYGAARIVNASDLLDIITLSLSQVLASPPAPGPALACAMKLSTNLQRV